MRDIYSTMWVEPLPDWDVSHHGRIGYGNKRQWYPQLNPSAGSLFAGPDPGFPQKASIEANSHKMFYKNLCPVVWQAKWTQKFVAWPAERGHMGPVPSGTALNCYCYLITILLSVFGLDARILEEKICISHKIHHHYILRTYTYCLFEQHYT